MFRYPKIAGVFQGQLRYLPKVFRVISGKEYTIDVGAHRDAPLHMIDTFRSRPGKNISGNHLGAVSSSILRSGGSSRSGNLRNELIKQLKLPKRLQEYGKSYTLQL